MEAKLRFYYPNSSDASSEEEYVISSNENNCFSETFHFKKMPNKIDIIVSDYPAIVYVARVLLEGLGDPAVESIAEELCPNLFANTKSGSTISVYFTDEEIRLQQEKERDTDDYEYEYFIKFYVFPLEDTNADRFEILRLVEKRQSAEMKKEEALALAHMEFAKLLDGGQNAMQGRSFLTKVKDKIKRTINH